VIVVAPAAQRANFEQALVSDARLAFHTVAVQEAARKVGIKDIGANAPGEQLFLHLAIKSPPKDQFARVEDRRSFFIWRLQRWIAAASAVAFGACVLFAGVQWIDLFNLGNQITQQQSEAREAAQQYERITASFPVTQTTTDNLKATVVGFTRIASQSASLEPAMVYLSQVVEKFPQMEIESIMWRVGKASEAGGAGAAAAAAKPAGTQPADAPAAAGGMLQMLEVTGRVNATKRSDYRAITGQVQRFAEALRTDPAWRILRTQLPFDVTSEGTLSGDIGTGEGTEAPRFVITVGRELK
jgi:hypothetical protein